MGSRRDVERTPDGRYLVIDGRRWRATDPSLPAEEVRRLRSDLGRARAAVKAAKRSGDEAALAEARSRVHAAKVGLGERGTPWWERPYAPAVAKRAVTGFGAGTTAEEALAGASLPAAVTRAEAVEVPGGANPSKVGTFVQRAALDPAALDEVPADLRDVVAAAAARLAAEPGLALAVDMGGSPAGQKMLARLAPASADARPWLVMALVDEG